MDVVVADRDAHGVSRDGHAFDHDVRVEHQDVAVLAGTGLALVRVAHQVLLAGELARHEAPLQARGETRAAAAAQARFLDGGDHLVLGEACAFALGQDLAQRFVAAARFVVLDAPVRAIQARNDLRADVAVMEAGLDARGLELREDLCGAGHACPSAALRPSTS
ncbi:hypothetical protein D3C71_1516120 [compost metagenome]